jgi:hypothetical protein
VAVNLDREDFRLWVTSKEPDERIGTRRSAGWCPLAQWIRERTGNPCVSVAWNVAEGPVFSVGTILGGDFRSGRLGPWATRFLGAVDRDPRNGHGGVTAKEALTILDSLEVAA